ncbi:hypothetical protein pEaSNUABM54_00099 [Erwinia phage pEa_SNUABM_54]|nr:hypothetical protein pEaSNUABM54_00099 [Erwinia phage pEa_SNUABM_54]
MISDAQFDAIERNAPQVAIKGYIDEDQKTRTGYAFLALDLLSRLPYHFTWGVSYPTVEELAVAQDGLIVPDAGPEDTIYKIYDLLGKAMFLPSGAADWRILNMLSAAGYLVARNFSQHEDDAYWVRTIRGHFVVYPPVV